MASTRAFHDAAVAGFWFALVLLAYTYVGYSVLMRGWAALRRRPIVRGPIRPTVSIVVVVFNEAARIGQRIENLLALDYPAALLDIIVASDGSTDATAAVAAAYGDSRVRVVACATRRGKASVLNDVVPRTNGEIVVLADARQRFDAHAVTALVERFADPSVGAVSGELHVASREIGDAAVHGTAVYWNVEKRIRYAESQVDSSIGATGAIYAIRKRLFEPLRGDTLLDDVVIPMRITRAGSRVVFEPLARAYDQMSESASQEFARKVRTIAGTFQLLAREPWLWNPLRNRLWVQTLSHKGLRLALPGLYVVLLAANVLLAPDPFYRFVLLGQVLFYGAALLGLAWRGPRRGVVQRLIALPSTIGLLTWATIVGFARFLTGRQRATWERPVLGRQRT